MGAASVTSESTDAPPAHAALGDVSPDDYCYVEAMIYYRVEETELARTLLRKDGVSADVSAHAQELLARDAAELDEFREWYVSWADARPVEPPEEGVCAGHGTDHAQMPGMPSWSRQRALADAAPPDAEREFVGILRAQNEGLAALVTLIIEADPHPRVAESAERVLAEASVDLEALERLAAALR
nr:DUF305 domain-containing protein [Microbacterium immunditiarum]